MFSKILRKKSRWRHTASTNVTINCSVQDSKRLKGLFNHLAGGKLEIQDVHKYLKILGYLN